MQLISLKKRINGTREQEEAEQEQINALLNKAAEKTAFEVEIGSGNGHFLVEYIKNKRDIFFAGIEIKNERCRRILKKIETQNLDNSCLIKGNAEDFIYNLPASVVDLFHIYFPDPWPKSKHKKRRFLRMPNLDLLCKSLKPGGKIFFATDIFDYYLQAKVLFILNPELKLFRQEPPQEIFKSLFANRFTELEKKIYFTAGEKRG